MSHGIFGLQNIFLGTIWPRDTMSLYPGQVLSGTVLQASTENAVIFINGLNVVAELETKVLAGEQLMLQVASRRADGKVVLKKFVSETETAASPAKLTNAELDAVLEFFSQTPGKVSRAVVQSLLDFRLPVSSQNVNTLTGLISRLGFSEPYTTPAVVWLWSNGLPVTREAVRATAWLMGQRPSSMETGALFALDPTPGYPEEIKLPEALQKAISNVFFKPEESPETTAVKLLELAKNLGLEHEKDLLRFISSPPEKAVTEETNAKAPRESLKAGLLRLLQTPEGNMGSEARTSAGRVLAENTCLQLLNLAGSRHQDGSTLFLQGWLVVGENSAAPFFLKIKDEQTAAGGQETRNYQVNLFTKTKSLGEIVCNLVLAGSRLDCRFTVSDRDARDFLERRTNFLAQRLEALPFQFVIHPSRVDAPASIDRLWFDEFFVPGTAGMLDAKI